jgi:NAD(P)H-dependent flavin oxidoreductase YrpB (nitropropane dioxygenase family)
MGGLGILAASRLMPEQLKEAINKIKSLTNRLFGANLLLSPPEPELLPCIRIRLLN